MPGRHLASREPLLNQFSPPQVELGDPTALSDALSSDESEAKLTTAERLALLDAMPVGVILIDRDAVIRFANLRTAEMIGAQRGDLEGRDVIDFVMHDDLDFVAELLIGGQHYSGQVMGPSRIRYIDAAGVPHWTQVWAHSCPPELDVDGFIVTLTKESVRDLLVTAVTSVALDDALDQTLEAVALSARAMPLEGTGVVLALEPPAGDDAVRFRPVGVWPLDPSSVNAYGTPWRRALVDEVDVDIDDVAASGLTVGARDSLLAVGAAGLFIRLIRDVGGDIVGIFVVFRHTLGPVSINQAHHLNDAVRLAALAFGQARRREELEMAAHRDALTGVANRAAFNERLESDRRHADVLFVDLDHFKSVNDTFGHQVGDAVVAEAAKRIETAIRRSDDVYRTGGDEFVVVCAPTGDDPSERIALAERIIERLMSPFDVDDKRVRIGATIGIAKSSDEGLNRTVRHADAALYSAKERGRAGWAHHH